MDNRNYLVQRRTAREVEALAGEVRTALGLVPNERASMLGIMENVLPELIDGFHIRIVEDHVLGGAEAVTDLDKPVITFSKRTYDRLYRGGPRERMTAAHEFGHLLMHTQRPRWAAFGGVPNPLVDAERQADLFAAAFMMPAEAFRKMTSIDEAMKTFGVSRDAATCRARRLGLKHLIWTRRFSLFAKKKGHGMNRTP